MDPPTHGLLGAVIGQAFFARTLGRRALLWGAGFNMLPDADVVMIPLLGGLAEWRYHRGLTHALWFAPVAGAALGWAAWRWQRRRADHEAAADAPGPWTWMALAVVSLLLHPLADAFTSYGTMLWWPSHRRYAWDALPIVDVIFTGVLLLALVVGRLWRRPWAGAAAAMAALALLVAYEAYALRLNARAVEEAGRQLAGTPSLGERQVRAYPVLMLPWLRRVVVSEGEHVAVGWVSTLRPRPIRWHRFETSRAEVVAAARRLEDVGMFEWFARGQTRAQAYAESAGWVVEIDDLRFGFPTAPEHGIWGVRAQFDEMGGPVGEVRRIRRPGPRTGALVRWLWRANLEGDVPTLRPGAGAVESDE